MSEKMKLEAVSMAEAMLYKNPSPKDWEREGRIWCTGYFLGLWEGGLITREETDELCKLYDW